MDDDYPEGAIVTLSDELVERIRHLSRVVKLLNVYSISIWDGSPKYFRYGEDTSEKVMCEDLRIEYTLLSITDSNFVWRSVLKHSPVEFETDLIDVSALD